MGIAQINKNTNHAFCGENILPFSKLTLSNMIKKFCWERFEDENSIDETKKLEEINPFDGSFQIKMDNSQEEDDTSCFIKIKSFSERAKEEGLL